MSVLESWLSTNTPSTSDNVSPKVDITLLKTPYMYFGNKSKIAPVIWKAFRGIKVFSDPFCGSAAILLQNPEPVRYEIINDADMFVSNFWRSVKMNPRGVAYYADFPKFEADLHARHTWLVTEGAQRLMDNRDNPEFFDVRVAGYWVWGLNNWRGRGWCAKAYEDNKRVWRQSPTVTRTGFMRKAYERYSDQNVLPANLGVEDYFYRLMNRLKHVKVDSGDWTRVVKPSMTTNLGETGIFFDPPYSAKADRDNKLYAKESKTVAQDVYRWCREHENTPKLRIALCGYEGEFEFPETWTTISWSTGGGLGNTKRTDSAKKGKENRNRERIWLSPNCLPIHE